MFSLNFFSVSSTKLVEGDSHQGQQDASSTVVVDHPTPETTKETLQASPMEGEAEPKTATLGVPATAVENKASTAVSAGSGPTPRSFTLFQSRAGRIHPNHKPALTIGQEQRKERRVVDELKHVVLSDVISSRSDKRAKRSAEIVRSLIVGTNATTTLAPAKTKPLPKAQLEKVKSDLSKPKSANKVIAHLRSLDTASVSSTSTASSAPKGPIHAVCLCASDEEVARTHFSRLEARPNLNPEENDTSRSVVIASLESVTSMWEDLHVVSLLSGDFGIGQPADGEGILSGAVPTAEAVMKGIEAITPELMSLVYATGQNMLPDHRGIYPPTDRMSVLTYWWGFELVLPSDSIAFLGKLKSISHTVLTFLTTLAAASEGVREVLPFVRYMSQFVEFEFDAIKSQNHGKGVVCTATWIMPMALVPRPWDFTLREESSQSTEPMKGESVASKPYLTEPLALLMPPADGNAPVVIRPTNDEPGADISDATTSVNPPLAPATPQSPS